MLPIAALTFRSRATEDLTDAEFEVLVLRVKTLNAMRGVTGAIIRRGDELIEYVEGEPSALDRAYERVVQSGFHTDVTVVERAAINDRVFDSFHEGVLGRVTWARQEQENARLSASLPAARSSAQANPPVRVLIETWDAWRAA